VSHGVRSKLDEIKRKEVLRLKQISKLQQNLNRGIQVPMHPAAAVARGMCVFNENVLTDCYLFLFVLKLLIQRSKNELVFK
jgi:hypothetical protein